MGFSHHPGGRKMATQDEFKQQIVSILTGANIPFVKEMAVGGLRADFVVFTPDGRKIIIEAKSWQKQPGFRQRAIVQARLYQETAGADHALVVVEHLQRSRISEGVVTADRLVEALSTFFSGHQFVQVDQESINQTNPEGTVFAAMPFDPRYDDVYFVAMAYAAEAIGATCLRVDQQSYSGDIVNKIMTMIEDSIAVIADLSESRPNVLYEAGLARGLGKKSIHICSTPLRDLPFDVRNWNTLKYNVGQTFEFRESLANRLRSVIERGS